MGNRFSDEKIDYEYAVMKYHEDMKNLMFEYKHAYDHDTIQAIRCLARRLVKLNNPQIKRDAGVIDEETLKLFFIESLKILENNRIVNYYKDVIRRTNISRDSKLDHDDGRLVKNEVSNHFVTFEVILPLGRLTLEDEIIYGHEMGHVPEIEHPRRSFLEYQEVLPIFLEYLVFAKRYGQKSAMDAFIGERIPMDIEHAKEIKYFCDMSERNAYIQQIYARLEAADSYKYLESTDFVLQLVDIFEKDKRKVATEINKVIEGKSFIDVAKDLSIETQGCKRLLKQYQTYGKRV
ncbi:MAG: hypothetical protein IKO78_01575 [Bacilli bacterium]|nr:hypothetical protein [Bacilli bacterium]